MQGFFLCFPIRALTAACPLTVLERLWNQSIIREYGHQYSTGSNDALKVSMQTVAAAISLQAVEREPGGKDDA